MPQTLSDPGACARCAAHFSTCCVIRPQDRECCFPLSAVERDAIIVACGEGALALSELQKAGGKRLPAREFLAGHPLQPGDRLGEA